MLRRQTAEKQTVAAQTASPQQPAAPQPKTPARRATISSLLRQVEHESHAAPPTKETPPASARPDAAGTQRPMEAIDPIRLNGAWQRFSSSLPPSEMYLRAIMNQQPKIKGNVVIVNITDPSQSTICKRTDLLSFLRSELGRADLTIESELDTSDQKSSTAPYTSTEKLRAMVASNKSLESLIEKFGLQLD